MKRITVGEGLEAVPGGIGFILSSPSTWGYALVPVAWLLVLTCGLSCAGIWGAWKGSTAYLGTDSSWWGHLGGWVLIVVAAVASLVLSLLVALVLAQPLSGFALEAISRAQHQALTGWSPVAPSLFSALLTSATVALASLVVAVLALGLLLLGLVVPPATVVTVPLNFLLGAWLLAWNFLDYPLSMHGLGLRARVGWAVTNFGAFTAFGVCWALLLVVPGMFLLVLPLGVAGATRLVVASLS